MHMRWRANGKIERYHHPAGFKRRSGAYPAYIRKMALDGYCVKLDLQDLKELTRLLRICSNNLNQYAKKANETGSIYQADIQDLQMRLDDLWQAAKELLVRLASIS